MENGVNLEMSLNATPGMPFALCAAKYAKARGNEELLQKIEELTLYIIAIEKENNAIRQLIKEKL